MLGALHQVAIGLTEPVVIRGTVGAGASFSQCERYRFTLWRTWIEDRPRAMFLMLNPSTADESKLDPTVTRCKKFAESWNYGGLLVCNIFAYRATDPKDMRAQLDPVGKGNNEIIVASARDVVQYGGVVVCAWGQHGRYTDRGEYVRRLLRDERIPLHYLRMGSNEQPTHPLYLPANLRPTAWR